jgi:hypothetical protein
MIEFMKTAEGSKVGEGVIGTNNPVDLNDFEMERVGEPVNMRDRENGTELLNIIEIENRAEGAKMFDNCKL